LARAQEVSKVLKEMLGTARSAVASGRDVTLFREILDKTALRVESDLKNQPEVQGDLWKTLAGTYADIHDPPHAISCYQHAVDAYRLALGDRHPKFACALCLLGHCQGSSAGIANCKLGVQAARGCGDPEILAYCLWMLAFSEP